MGRPNRIEYPGALYHVISRGNEKQRIFSDEADRLKFLEIIKDYHARYGVLVHCYSLMDNHYHLILETPKGNLLKSMHGINGSYTGYFNRKHERAGHLFQGRYKGILVDKDEYLMPLSRYVHLNPVRAGIVQSPDQYRWSSYPAYVFGRRPDPWVEYSWVLSKFGDGSSSRRRYRKYVEDSDGEEEVLKNQYDGFILGGEGFISRIKKMLSGKPVSREIPERERLADFPLAEDIIRAVSLGFKVAESSITKSGRDNVARKAAVYLVKRYSGQSNAEIGRRFGGIHYSAVSKIYARFMQEIHADKKLENAVYQVMSHVKT